MSTFTTTVSSTFTLLHAKQLASRVAADMKRCQQMYGYPSDDQINRYGTELAHLLNGGYVEEYEFGYKRQDKRVISCHYRVRNGDLSAVNDRPGGIASGVDITGASPFNFLTHSAKWDRLSQTERDAFEATLPFRRGIGSAPSDGLGCWQDDKSYSAAGTVMSRRVFRPYTT
jgi:hypothetical protein